MEVITVSATAKKQNNPDPFKEPDGLRLTFVDPKKDVFKAQAVIGPASPEFYQKKILEELVGKVMKTIQPSLEEKQGYEIMKYELIIKKLDIK